MEYNVFVELEYKHKKVRKFFIVKKVLDLTHMKKVLNVNLKIKYNKMISHKIINVIALTGDSRRK